MSEFLLYVVHDTINKRGRPWQFAQELMLVMLKRIDDAGDLKKLNLLNIVNEAHLNTVYEEAMESAKYFYPAIFRAHPGKGEDDVCAVAGADGACYSRGRFGVRRSRRKRPTRTLASSLTWYEHVQHEMPQRQAAGARRTHWPRRTKLTKRRHAPNRICMCFAKPSQTNHDMCNIGIMGQPRFELGFESRRNIFGPSPM